MQSGQVTTTEVGAEAHGLVRRTRSAYVGVQSERGSHRLVAVQPIDVGTMLFYIEGELTSHARRHSLQIDENLHLDGPVEPSEEEVFDRFFWRYLNHSCAPNTRIRDRALIAVRDIASGDDVTFDYNTTEYAMAEPFDCHCGAPACLGRVQGFKFLTTAQQERLRPVLPPYLIRTLDGGRGPASA